MTSASSSSSSSSTSSPSCSSSSRDTLSFSDLEKEVTLCARDFQGILESFCYECSKVFTEENNDIVQREQVCCGLRCGATFCDRQCYRSFLASRYGRSHIELCQLTTTIRQVLRAVRVSRRGTANSAQFNTLVREGARVAQRVRKDTDAILSQDHLMVTLLLCESAWFVDREDVLFLLRNAVYWLGRLSLWEKLVFFGRAALTVAKRNFGENSKEFAGCLREVADWLRQARPLDAKLLFERSASIYASTVGVNSKEQKFCSAEVLQDIGNLLKSMCRFDDAVEKFEQSGKILHKLLGDCKEYASVLVNLAIVFNAMKHFDTALAYQQVALNITQRLFGADHEECAGVLCNMGGTLCALGRYDEARVHCEHALRIRTDAHDRGTELLGTTYLTLGNIASKQNRLDDAKSMYSQADFVARLSDSSAGIAKVSFDVANHLLRQRQLDEALTCLQQSLKLNLSMHGDNAHEDVASVCEKIGQVLLLQRDFSGAIEHFERALAMFGQMFDLQEDYVGGDARRGLAEARESQLQLELATIRSV